MQLSSTSKTGISEIEFQPNLVEDYADLLVVRRLSLSSNQSDLRDILAIE